MAAATLAALRRLWAPAAGATPLRRWPTALPAAAISTAAAAPPAASDPPSMSKRKQFRQVPVAPSLLARIQAEGTCRRRLSPAERAARRRPRKPQADEKAARDPTARVHSLSGTQGWLGCLALTPASRSPAGRPAMQEFARSFRFVGAAAVASSFPDTDLPEVAFAGT